MIVFKLINAELIKILDLKKKMFRSLCNFFMV